MHWLAITTRWLPPIVKRPCTQGLYCLFTNSPLIFPEEVTISRINDNIRVFLPSVILLSIVNKSTIQSSTNTIRTYAKRLTDCAVDVEFFKAFSNEITRCSSCTVSVWLLQVIIVTKLLLWYTIACLQIIIIHLFC